MSRQVVVTEGAPSAVGAYSQGVKTEKFVYTAGQLGLVPSTKQFAGADIQSQTRQSLENVKAVLEAGGSSMQHVLKVTVFMIDLREFGPMNEVYASFFPVDPPARSAIQVAALPLGGRVEIEAVGKVVDAED